MKISEKIIQIEDFKLLPETHDFFDTHVSKAIKFFLYSILILILSLITWSSIAKMDDIIKVSAILRPIENISDLRVRATGEIIEKSYFQNQMVKKGDILLKIDSSIEKKELQVIEKQKKDFEKEYSLLNNLYLRICSENYDTNEVNFIQAESYISDYKKMKLQIVDLQRKYESELSMPELLRNPKKIEEYANQLEQAKFSLDLWKNNKLITLKELLDTYEERIQSYNNRIVTLERSIENSIIHAPIDGYVDEKMSLSVGDYILAGTEVLRIIPSKNTQLKAELLVDASKIANLRLGQEVYLRFPGLPLSSFGQLKGIITLIPTDFNVSSNNAFFIVDARVPEPYLYSSNGDKLKLHSGMNAEAIVIISQDNVLRRVLRKLDFIN